jgi:hypothetical protein
MSAIFGEPRGVLRKGLVIRNGVIVTEAEAASVPAPVATPAEIQAAVVKCGAGGPSALPASAPRVWVKSALSLEERFAVCRSVGEECIQVRGCRVQFSLQGMPSGALPSIPYAVLDHRKMSSLLC